MTIRKTIDRLRTKWAIESMRDFWLIMVVFSLAGMNVSLIRRPLFYALGFTRETAIGIKIITYILFVFPTYQISLLLYGGLLGQFKFFWNKQKKIMQFISKGFSGRYKAAGK